MISYTFLLVSVCTDGRFVGNSFPFQRRRHQSSLHTQIFSTQTREEVHQLHSHTDRVNALAFAPQHSDILATASRDKSVKIFHGSTGKLARTLRGHSAEVLCVAFAPGGRMLASGGADRDIFLWEVRCVFR
jgi:WD40 repeat protein